MRSSRVFLVHVLVARAGAFTNIRPMSTTPKSTTSVDEPGSRKLIMDRSLGIGSSELFAARELVDSSGDESVVENLNSLTVPLLKEKLRGLGLPVGGRKAELIERLHTAVSDTKDVNMANSAFRLPDEVGNPSISEKKRSSIADTLDEILDCDEGNDGDDDDQSLDQTIGDEYDNIQHLVDSSDEESASARRAKRKKFWKTQEVRDLIKANNPSAAAKAEEMIFTLEDISKQENDDNYLPGPIQYTLLIDAYAKSGTVDATQRAEAVIDRLLNSSSSAGLGVTPTAQMMNAVMSTYANIGTVDAATKATAILERMEYLKEFGQLVKPTVHSYSIAISAWAKCGSGTAAENAERILNRLFDDYNEVLSRGDNKQYAEELMPNNVVFNSVIDAW